MSKRRLIQKHAHKLKKYTRRLRRKTPNKTQRLASFARYYGHLAAKDMMERPPRRLPDDFPEGDPDFEHPWWCMIQIEEFSGYKPAQGSVLLIALPPRGASAPIWKAVHRLFERKFNALVGKKSHMGMITADLLWQMDRNPGLAARIGRLMDLPGHPFPAMAEHPHFNRLKNPAAACMRRARRRGGRPAPRAWVDLLGENAHPLWSAGSGIESLRNLTEQARLWPIAIECMRDALCEHGALACFEIPQADVAFPNYFHDSAALEKIDAGMLDPIRQRWAISKDANDPSDHLARDGRSQTKTHSL